jgi:iron-sulfur cluster repair protein YtfE (RIC family)
MAMVVHVIPSIQVRFAGDHDRLDKLFSDYQRFKRSNSGKAKEAFREFKFGLQRHIVWEEDIFFPLFEKKTGLAHTGPTEVMRMEHRIIGAYLEAIHTKVRQQDPNTDDEEEALLGALFAHNQKEERVLYPTLERLLSDDEKVQAFVAMAKLPEEAYRTCCGHG